MSAEGGRWRWLSLPGAVVLLVVTVLLADPQAIAAKLGALDPQWVLLGILLSIPTYMTFALRWYLVTQRLGAPITYARSLKEYYLGTFVNQTLPTGLAGAALRAMRHAKSDRPDGRPVGYATAIRGVVLERISGLACLAIFALVGAAALGAQHPQVGLYGAGAVVAIVLSVFFAFRVADARAPAGTSFVQAARDALLSSGALVQHLLVSSLGVVLLVLGFYCAARATAVGLSLGQTFLVAPLILGAMVIPLAIAGWGVREAAAAALFAALGADAATGVAVAITFGVIGLLSSLPGLVILLMPRDLGTRGVVEHPD
jgi:uncharacterized membrane protein YbhN (UPF0104 family)